MIYTEEFQKTLLFTLEENSILNIENEIKNNNHNKVRLLLEKEMDNPLFFKNGKVLDNYKKLYNERKKLYSLFMTHYIKYLDANNSRRR